MFRNRVQSVFAVDSVTGKSDKIWSNEAVTTNTQGCHVILCSAWWCKWCIILALSIRNLHCINHNKIVNEDEFFVNNL